MMLPCHDQAGSVEMTVEFMTPSFGHDEAWLWHFGFVFWHLGEYHTLVKEMLGMCIDGLTCECIPCSNSEWCFDVYLLNDVSFASKFCVWHKRPAGPGCGCVSNHHSEFYSSRHQCAGRNLFWTLNVWNGLCCLNVWQLLWGLKRLRFPLGVLHIPTWHMSKSCWSLCWFGHQDGEGGNDSCAALRIWVQRQLLDLTGSRPCCLKYVRAMFVSRVQKFVCPRNACDQSLIVRWSARVSNLIPFRQDGRS